MLQKHVIFGVHITERVKHASEVQEILTEHGVGIKTRLGLHEVNEDYCSPNGLLILEMVGSDEVCDDAFNKLNAIEGVEAQRMVFEHP